MEGVHVTANLFLLSLLLRGEKGFEVFQVVGFDALLEMLHKVQRELVLSAIVAAITASTSTFWGNRIRIRRRME